MDNINAHLSPEEMDRLTEHFEKIFVRKDNCNDRHEKTEKEISNILIEQSKANTKLSFIEWLGGFTLTATLGGLIAQICGAVFK